MVSAAKIKLLLIAMVVVGSFSSMTAGQVQAAERTSRITVETKEIHEETEAYKLQISIPVVSGLVDNEFQDQLNDTLMKHALKEKEAFIKEAIEVAEFFKDQGIEGRQSELIRNFQLKQTGVFVSIVVDTYTYTGGAHGNETREYHNFVNSKEAALLQLNDLFKDHSNYKEKLNEMITEQIKERTEQGEMFFEGEMGFRTIHEDQGYYIEESDLVITFPKYEIAPGAAGIPEFKIPLAEMKPMMKRSTVKALKRK